MIIPVSKCPEDIDSVYSAFRYTTTISMTATVTRRQAKRLRVAPPEEGKGRREVRISVSVADFKTDGPRGCCFRGIMHGGFLPGEGVKANITFKSADGILDVRVPRHQ